MSISSGEKRSWSQIIQAWTHPRVITMLFLGFSAGIPILLIFSTLGLWLREAGFSRSTVTFFSWAALAYSFKFIWAPLIDKIPLPYLTKRLGRRRAWMLISQFMVIIAIISMANIDPAAGGNTLVMMALATVLLGFSSATQDIVIDAFRIECIDESYQAMLSAMYISGYRIAMMVAGAGALYLASYLGTTSENYVYFAWQVTYFAMAAVMLVGIVTTLVISEPEINLDPSLYSYSVAQYLRLFCVFVCCCTVFAATFFFSSSLAAECKQQIGSLIGGKSSIVGFGVETIRLVIAVANGSVAAFLLIKVKAVNKDLVSQAYIEPIMEFIGRYRWQLVVLLLLLVGFYRVSDIVLGVISNIFYADVGFSKNVIGSITKVYGLFMTILGTFLGGTLTLRYGVYPILFLGALLSAATNLLFMVLAKSGASVILLTSVIAIDNLSAGIASVAFVAFLSGLTSISFTATQYALFSSLMTLFPKLIGGYSGTIVDGYGYNNFFVMTAVIGVPILLLIAIIRREIGSLQAE